jgi:hypothetical protein
MKCLILFKSIRSVYWISELSFVVGRPSFAKCFQLRLEDVYRHSPVHNAYFAKDQRRRTNDVTTSPMRRLSRDQLQRMRQQIDHRLQRLCGPGGIPRQI